MAARPRRGGSGGFPFWPAERREVGRAWWEGQTWTFQEEAGEPDTEEAEERRNHRGWEPGAWGGAVGNAAFGRTGKGL